MSTRSCPLFEEEAFVVTEIQEVASERLVGKGARVKTYNKRRNVEEDRAVRVTQLRYERAGLLGTLRRLRKEITGLLSAGEMSLLSQRLNTYEKTWIKFVKAHEKFVELLDTDTEKNKAQMVYDEEFEKKIDLDSAVKQLDDVEGHSNSSHQSSHRKSKSRSIVSSCRSSKSSVKSLKQKMALARINVEHLKKRQEIAREQSELNFAQEILEAEMEVEKACVSYAIYEEETGAGDREKNSWTDECDIEPDVFKHKQQVSENVSFEDPVKCSVDAQHDVELKVAMNKSVRDSVSEPLVKNSGASLLTADGFKQPVGFSSTKQPKQFGVKTLYPPVVTDNEKIHEYVVSSQPQGAQASVSQQQGQLRHVNEKIHEYVVSSQPQGAQASVSQQQGQLRQVKVPVNIDNGEQLVKALSQVINTPKIEYMHFDGNPINYVSFMHNFETCLERNSNDDSRNLQFLIQHCTGRAREAIRSCVNLPVSEGYQAAKNTLKENFGMPHIIAKAHLKKLEDLPQLKNGGGPALLEFSRHLESADRTLKGMGPEYVSDLDHTNTLRELSKKLPFFLRGRWAECAGKIIESEARPRFSDFLKFVKRRAKLVNNEFGEDLVSSPLRDKGKSEDKRSKNSHRAVTMATGVASIQNSEQESVKRTVSTRKCAACSGDHGLWKCAEFKRLAHDDRSKLVLNNRLCFKCLSGGHFKDRCPKTTFKCRVQGCSKDHHTLLHFTPKERKSTGGVNSTQFKSEDTDQVSASSSSATVTIATGASEKRVCLGVIPVKVKAKSGDRVVETYALLDSGSEVTLCQEKLYDSLGFRGSKLNFELTGVTGSRKVEGYMIDLVVMSMDECVSEELLNVRTVKQIPVSNSCIPKKEDVSGLSHLRDIDLKASSGSEVSLIIGLKENPKLFIPLEYREGGSGEPVAVRYSLGWAIMGPVNGTRNTEHCSINFVRLDNTSKQYSNKLYEQSGNEKEWFETANPVVARFDEEADRYQCVESYCSKSTLIDEMEGDLQTKDTVTEQEIRDEVLQAQLEKLWKTDFGDSVVSSSVSNSIEDKKALEIMERTLKRVNGHFQVALPWRTNPPYLPNNRSLAERRCAFLKKRLLKDGDLFAKYKVTMNDYITQGHAEKIPPDELNPKDRPVWYLPHHPVTHPLKQDKVRVVFDCAAKYRGTSLNEQLLQGPDLTNHLVGVLSRFRQEPIGMVADIEGMFHQVQVEPSDCDALRFLWWPDADLNGELEEYRMVKHLFGATSSPSVANFCLKKTLELNESHDPEVTSTVDKNMYVDDLMKSTDTTSKAVSLVKNLRELLDKGGFRLTKWYSNDRAVIASIPECERAKSVVNLQLERLPTQSTLGLKWNIEDDKFIWEVLEKFESLVKKKPITRRGILSVVYSLFDPLGFIAPYIMKAKLLLQTLSRKKIGWDDQLEEIECRQWMRWLEDLVRLEEVNIDRCFKPKEFVDIKDIQLHMFSDASRQGYSSVAYLRFIDAVGRIHCSFVMAKARLAPIREISIPRLELTAAVVSVKLSKAIRDELDLTISKVTYWTDSTSVLKCINNKSKRFQTFESNRLTIIHDGSTPKEWRYVNREVNPADDGSKGLKLDALLNNDRWLTGPRFLWENETQWPNMVNIPDLEDDDPAIRKEKEIYITTVSRDVIEEIIMYHSSWWKLKLTVVWLLRYKQFLKSKVLQRKGGPLVADWKEKRGQFITVKELSEAERVILQYVQAKEFSDAIAVQSELTKEKDERLITRLMKKAEASVCKLNPRVEDGLLRAGGRLGRAPLDYELKHPVILPYKHRVTDLIIEDCHLGVGHMGQESVLSSLRNKFWIVKGRSAVRRVLRKCLHCQKRRVKPVEQFMADLPQERVTPCQPPFTHTGVDYFGPMEVKQGRSRVKRYGCLFTCLTVRAVHIEISHSLNTDSMINALRRFISIRGCPKVIRSDNGTNLTRADKEIKDEMEQWNNQKINNFCAQKGIEWKFIPPSASHMGGVWERMVQTSKRVLKSLLKEQLVSDEVLSTVMAEAINIINSRPLTRNSESTMDQEPLTPNHLLHLRHTSSLPPGIFNKEDLHCRREWRQAQYLSTVFWRRWINEYVPTLMERKKWCTPKENVKVGDLVLLVDENYRRGEWPIARVVEVIVSSDGLVRTARVKTASTVATHAKRRRKGDIKVTNTVLTRPVTSLCRLEFDVGE